MNEPLVRRYYECFNDRRFAGAAAMMADDAELGLLSMGRERGPAGYLHFTKLWTAAFPDARFSLKGIEPRGETLCEAYLTATGTQEGILEFGVYRFNPTGVNTRLNMREQLDIRADKIHRVHAHGGPQRSDCAAGERRLRGTDQVSSANSCPRRGSRPSTRRRAARARGAPAAWA